MSFYGLCALTFHKWFFLTSGGNKNTVQEYDVDKNEWITLPNVNYANQGFLLGLPDNAKLN